MTDKKEGLYLLDVFAAIQAERRFQDSKWGPLDQQNDRLNRVWLSCLAEEMEELANEIAAPSMADLAERGCAATPPPNKLTDEAMLELVQVLAVGIAWLQQLGSGNIEALVMKHREGDAG